MRHDFVRARDAAGAEFDRARMESALRASNGVVLAAARSLGVKGPYFWNRAKQVGLDIGALRLDILAAPTGSDAEGL